MEPLLRPFALALSVYLAAPAARALPAQEGAQYAREHYQKREVRIPMRDGVELFAAIYSPRDAGQPGAPSYPILLCRTPYSVGPYGPDQFKNTIGPSEAAMKEGFIVVYEDVRGCYMSGGEFVDVRPHIENKTGKQFDESSDAWDTIDWLVKNVEGHNTRVGMWGISYPGFYAAAGMIDAHAALAAVSPQAPIADWWFDDFHHHGALFLPHAFNFLSGFGRPRPEPTTTRAGGFDHKTKDGYEFFLGVGPLSEVNQRWFGGEVKFWDDLVRHPDYDEFWSARNLQPHLKRVAPAVMTVGGWFDAEDLYGALHTYQAVESQNEGISNVLVMGPWAHGAWARTDGERLGRAEFGAKTAAWYREQVELAFFNRNLKSKYDGPVFEATMFETGANRWRSFDAWPPPERQWRFLRFGPQGRLTLAELDGPAAAGGGESEAWDEFVSDPADPVPYTEAKTVGMTKEYMTDDQSFAALRPDVKSWRTEVLDADLTLAGPLDAQLWVSTDQSDADWIVKLIDVFPPEGGAPAGAERSYRMLVRSEVMRGRFRDGYGTPRPFEPGSPTLVRVPLQDVLHTFRKGHRVEVQVQSTWFPLVDRNPQKFVPSIYAARPEDFVKARHRVYRDAQRPSRILVGVL